MSHHRIQFTAEDVVARFRELAPHILKNPDYLSSIAHSLQSPILSIYSRTGLFHGSDFTPYALDIVGQIDYADNVRSLSKEITGMQTLFLRDVEAHLLSINKFSVMAEEYIALLGKLAQNVEMLCNAKKTAPFSEKAGKNLSEISAYLVVLLYTANRIFSPDFRRDSYYLAEDITAFEMEMGRPLQDCGIHFGVQQTHKIRTLDDYVGNAVAPIVLNAKEHAFDPENDLYKRLESGDMYKSITIWLLLDEAKTSPGEFDIVVRDNGFGIKPEVLDVLFERGATTKTDTSTEHGIGLWGVKQFVEKYGGKIWVGRTEIGKGTEFWFSIPYSHMDSFVYVQS